MQVIATSTAPTLTFFILPHPSLTEAQQVLIRSQDAHFCQGWQTHECSMQSQAETDTHSQVYLLVSPSLLSLSNTHTYTLSLSYIHTYTSLWPCLHIYFIFHVCLQNVFTEFALKPPLHSCYSKKHSYTMLLICCTYPCVTAQCDANKQDCNLLSSDSQQWQGIKQTTVGDVFGSGSKPGARSLCKDEREAV